MILKVSLGVSWASELAVKKKLDSHKRRLELAELSLQKLSFSVSNAR